MIRMIKTFSLVSVFVLSACSASYVATQQYPVSGFPYRYRNFDYKVAWKTTQANNVVIIDGILKNVRYAFIDNLNLTVFLLGKDGKARAQATSIPVPQHSRMNEVVPFSTELHNVALTPGDTLQFLIHYSGSEGGPDDGVDWRSIFAADAMTGETLHKKNVTPEEW